LIVPQSRSRFLTEPLWPPIRSMGINNRFPPQRGLPVDDHPLQALFSDRAHESLREGV
jgi:hypothetical protein